ncbi:MAG: hypothetical protein J5490_05100 [Bacteroidales bacterium]|nr:hypothetical protein [Bacteroidales bacterium]
MSKFGKFIKQINRPFSVIPLHKMAFFLWGSFTLFGGLIGIIVSILKHWLFAGCSFPEAVFIETQNGSFYTYSIAMLAAVLSTVFINFSEQQEIAFRRYKIPTITFCIFVLFFGGIFYALSFDSKATGTVYNAYSGFVIDWKQLVVFILSMILSIYSFCVCRLDQHSDEFQDIADNYNTTTELDDSIENYLDIFDQNNLN